METDKIEAPEAIEGGPKITANGTHLLAPTNWPGGDPTVVRVPHPDE